MKKVYKKTEKTRKNGWGKIRKEISGRGKCVWEDTREKAAFFFFFGRRTQIIYK